MKINYKKLSNDLTDWAQSSDWKRNRTLRVELTSFEPVHRVNRGRNGVSELVELQTVVTEADGVYIETKPRSSLLEVYVSSKVRVEHGFGSKDRGIVIRYRDAKGKYSSINVYPQHYDTELGTLRHVFGYEVGATLDPEGFKYFVDQSTEDVITLAGTKPEPSESDLTKLKREFTDKVYYRMVSDLERGCEQELVKLCEHVGLKLVKTFAFVQRYWVSPQFVNVTSSGIELGWYTNQTYNSLPMVLKISKVKEIRTVKLKDLGIERAGYYSYTDNMQVLPEHVEAAKRFANKFDNAKTKAVKRALEEVA